MTSVETGLPSRIDRVFAAADYPSPFAFDQRVASVFDDMAARSIPLYAELNASVCAWAVRYYEPGSCIYDAGCSTGTALSAIGKELAKTGRHATLVGIDSSPAMLLEAEAKLAPLANAHTVRLNLADVADSTFAAASVIICNYTLQFMPFKARVALLERAYAALPRGGLLYVSDKVTASTPAAQATLTELYEDFKFAQGYSRDEIARKREALRDVLVPMSCRAEWDLLVETGFRTAEPVLKFNNFVSFVAIKD